MNTPGKYFTTNKQTKNAIRIVVCLFLCLFIAGYFIYRSNHYSNAIILEKVKAEINSQKDVYTRLYQYLADSTNDQCPVSSVMYRGGWDYVIFSISDEFNHEKNSHKEVPSFFTGLNFGLRASFDRRTQSMNVDLPFSNYRLFSTAMIYCNTQSIIIKKYSLKGYQLCESIDEVSKNKNSMIRVDANWLLFFIKTP